MYGRAKYGVDYYGGIFYRNTLSLANTDAAMSAAIQRIIFGPTVTFTGSASAAFTSVQVFAGSVSFSGDATFIPSDTFVRFSPDTDVLDSIRTITPSYEVRSITITSETRSVTVR